MPCLILGSPGARDQTPGRDQCDMADAQLGPMVALGFDPGGRWKPGSDRASLYTQVCVGVAGLR